MNSTVRRRHMSENMRNTRNAALFLLPNTVGFLLFSVIPVGASLVISLFDWPLIGDMRFVGFENYVRLFTKDGVFLKVLGNTSTYVLFYVAFNIVLAMSLALWLTTGIKGARAYRALFFIPQVTPIVATAMIWKFLFLPDFGLVNHFLSMFGVPSINWLGSMDTAMAAIIIMSLWQGFGYNMVIFIAGIYGIPSSLKEAARIDGAGRIAVFRHITLPMLSPSIFFAVVMTVISSFQVFDQTLVMTAGGPGNATNTIVLYLYQNAFTYLRMGYASAMAWVLFVIIMAVTLVQMRLQKEVVVYE